MMDNQKAIRILKARRKIKSINIDTKLVQEAYDTAIEALEKQAATLPTKVVE